MKKSYLMIAAAAALFAACSSNDNFNEIDTQEVPISFRQSINKITRAHIGSIDNLKTEDGFVVYGYKSLDDFDTKENPDIFAGKNVYWNSTLATPAWVYDGLRFWDKNATYNFYAVAPYNPTDGATYAIQSDPTTTNFGRITITGAKSNKSTASDDYLIDRDGATGEHGSAHTGSTNPPVDIDFHHIMAKVQFKLKSTLSSGTITVTKLTMKGWDNGVATFAQNMSYTANPGSIVYDEWTFTTHDKTKEIYLVGGTSPNNASDDEIELTCAATSPTVLDVTDWYIMVPQQIAYTAPAQNVTEAGLTFTVTYTYNDGLTPAYEETFEDQVVVVPSTQTWGTDSYTTYTLDIKPNEIKFDVKTICNFDEANTPADVEVK